MHGHSHLLAYVCQMVEIFNAEGMDRDEVLSDFIKAKSLRSDNWIRLSDKQQGVVGGGAHKHGE